MITKRNKPTLQEKIAIKDLKKVARHYKKKEKRITTLIRVQEKWRRSLKERAWNVRKTVSKLHDEIYPIYFKHVEKDKPSLKGITN
jgi:hypothetical protein